MKKIDLLTSLILVPVDYVMLMLAAVVSYSVRYQGFVTQIRPVFFDYPFREFFPLALAIALVGLIFFALNGLYSITTHFSPFVLLAKVFMGVSTTMLVIIVSIFLRRELFSSRFIILVAWFLAVAFVYGSRLIVSKIKATLVAHGFGSHYVTIIGAGKVADEIIQYFEDNKAAGVKIATQVKSFSDQTLRELETLSQTGHLNEILVTDESINRDHLTLIISFCHERNILYRYVASTYQMKMLNFETDNVTGYPIIQINKTPLVGWGRVLKRSFDLILGVCFILILLPLFPIIAFCIRIDSRGPVFVQLKRVGRWGRIFTLYKFRSMIENAHAMKPDLQQLNERNDGPLFKIKNDPRITRCGRFLRRSSLDELPQLWNVLRGEMSLIGPRPHEPEEVNRYGREDRDLLAIKPGMTGMSQVSGRSGLLFSEEVKLDIFYVENWSILLDFQILLKTIKVLLRFKDAV